MQHITWQQGAELCKEIRTSPPGDWTHDLNTIRNGPARFVDRVMSPEGKEIVYFRTEDGAGAWSAANWERFAVAREITGVSKEIEQMVLF